VPALILLLSVSCCAFILLLGLDQPTGKDGNITKRSDFDPVAASPVLFGTERRKSGSLPWEACEGSRDQCWRP